MVDKEMELQVLLSRVKELEQQLAEARRAIHNLQAGDGQHSSREHLHKGPDLLPASDDLFRQVFLAAPYPLMIWWEDGRVMMVNATFTEITGYTLQDIPSMEKWVQRALGGRQYPSMVIDENISQENIKKWRELEITTRSGQQRIWDFSDAILSREGSGDRLMITMAVDITERRQIEEQMQESEEKYSIVFEKAPFAAALSKLPEGILVNINEEFERTFGYTRQEAVGRTSLDLGIHPDAGVRARIAGELQERGSARNVETLLHTKAGDARTFLLNIDMVSIGRQKYALQTAQDITERKRAEEALLERERQQEEMSHLLELDRARLNTILNHLPVGVWISDREGRLASKNQQADRIWAGEAPLLQSIEEYGQYQAWHPESGLPFQPDEYPMAIAQRTGQAVEPMEMKIRRFDGSEGTVLVSAVPIRDDQGSMTGIVAVNVDITDRKQAEKELQDSEERFSKAFHKSPFGMNITRWQDGVILDANDAWLNLLGWTKEEVIGKTTAEFPFYAQPEDRRMVRDRITQEEVPGDLEIHVRRKDGHELVVEVSTTLIELQGERCILGALNDITERKRAEEALKESEQRYRGLFERMQEGLVAGEVITDADGKPVDYRYVDVNPATERQFGMPREQFIGRTYTEMLPDGDQEWIEILGNVAITGEPASVERFGRASKKWFEAHAYSPRPGQFVNILTDITERKKAENALRQSEERFAKAFHSSPDAVIISRMSDGLIIEVNEGWRTIFGHKQSEVVGRTSVELGVYLHPEDREKAISLLKERGSLRDFEIQVRRKSGEIRHASMSVEKIQMNGVDYILTIMRDVTERKKAEEHIAYQARLLASVNDAIVGSDAEFRLTAWNAAAESIYGWKSEEVLGRNGVEILQTEWPQEEAGEMRRQIAETGRWRGEATQLRKDGTRIAVEVSSMVLRDEQGRISGYVSVNRDITERKKVERALRASEAKMRAVFRALTEGVVFLNRNGVIEEANDAVQHTYGHTLQELTEPALDPRTRIIRPDGTLFPIEEQPAIVALRTGQTVRDVELGVPLQDGKISWRLVNAQPVLDDEGTLLGAVASFFDITERRQAEQALRESEQRFRSLADSMPQLVWTALPDGSVDYYNQRHLEYREIKSREGSDWDWAPVLHPDDVQITVDAWLHSVETGDIYQIEHRVRMSDGSYRWHLSRGVPMLDEKGQVVRWFGTATDIHDLKLAEEKLKIYASRLEQSNRELEQFAFMASHDLQEPLRKIEMFGDLLLERAASLQEHERNYLERMRNAASRMRDMIEGLLQISRVATQRRPFVQVDLSQVTSDVLSDFENQIQNSDARVEVEPLPSITGDPLQLRQLMQNLIGNALKYHQPGKSPEILISAHQLDDRVQIRLEDKGIGFDQEDADRIFEPFQRLVGRNQYQGSGIGLAICRRIVERHGGEIAAMSEQGIGTTFIVTLPIRPPKGGESGAGKEDMDEE